MDYLFFRRRQHDVVQPLLLVGLIYVLGNILAKDETDSWLKLSLMCGFLLTLLNKILKYIRVDIAKDQYINQTLLDFETPVNLVAKDKLLILDNTVFSIDELLSLTGVGQRSLFFNPYTSTRYSDNAMSLIRNNKCLQDKLNQFVSQLKTQNQSLSKMTIKWIRRLAWNYKSHKENSNSALLIFNFLNYCKQLKPQEKDALENYLIVKKYKDHDVIDEFKDCMDQLNHDGCIVYISTSIWAMLRQVQPSIQPPKSLLALMEEEQYEFNEGLLPWLEKSMGELSPRPLAFLT